MEKRKKGKLIAVTSVRGGEGRTIIAKELAMQYATQSIKGQSMKVCLVDFNLMWCDMIPWLGLSETVPDIIDWAKNIRAIKDSKPDSRHEDLEGVFDKSNPYLLAYEKAPSLTLAVSSNKHKGEEEITSEEISFILTYLQDRYDVVIIDTGTENSTLPVFHLVDDILMVIIPLPSTLYDVRRIYEGAKEDGGFPTEKIKHVFNSCGIYPKEIALLKEQFEFGYIGIVPEYKKMQKIYAKRTSVCVYEKEKHKFNIAMKNIAEALV